MDVFEIIMQAQRREDFFSSLAASAEMAGNFAAARRLSRKSDRYRRLADRAWDRGFERVQEFARAAGMTGGQ
jgi:hypothetical protein